MFSILLLYSRKVQMGAKKLCKLNFQIKLSSFSNCLENMKKKLHTSGKLKKQYATLIVFFFLSRNERFLYKKAKLGMSKRLFRLFHVFFSIFI